MFKHKISKGDLQHMCSYRSEFSCLRKEFDTLTTELNHVKAAIIENDGSHNKDKTNWEEIFLRLTSQNENLYKALEKTHTENIQMTQQLSAENQKLKCQIEHLNRRLCSKEVEITEPNVIINNRAHQVTENVCNCDGRESRSKLHLDLETKRAKIDELQKSLEQYLQQERILNCENRKLNEELTETKEINNNKAKQLKALNDFSQSVDCKRKELIQKYKELEKISDNQKTMLQTVNTKNANQQVNIATLEKQLVECETMRTVEKREIFSLKQRIGELTGINKSLEQQVSNGTRENDMLRHKSKLDEINSQQMEVKHTEEVNKLQKRVDELSKKLETVWNDFKDLKDVYNEQLEICKTNEKIMDLFHNWKNEQLEADKCTRQKICCYKNNIKLFLEEKQGYLEKFKSLAADNNVLKKEIERLKTFSLEDATVFPNKNINIGINHTISELLHTVQESSKRIAHHIAESKILKFKQQYDIDLDD